MSGLAAFILVALVTFAAVIWPTRKAAQLVGAERTGYGTVVLAMVLSLVLVVGLGFLLGALSFGRGSGIGAGLALAVAVVYLYSKVFGTGMLGAFLIMLIANVIGVVVSLVLAAVLGLGGSLLGGGGDISRVRAAVDEACLCDGDTVCLEVQQAVLESEMEKQVANLDPESVEQLNAELERLESCLAEQPAAEPAPGSAPASGSRPESSSAPDSQPAQPARAPATRFVYVWQDADVDQLRRRVGELVRFELNDGRIREGVLKALTDEGASLQSSQSRGLSYEVSFETVKSMQVYVRTVE